MDTTTTPTPSALDALRTAEFRLSLRGYDVDEVDDFLERAAVEADQLREQMRQATAQVAQATERVRVLEQERATGAPAAAAAAAPAAAKPAPSSDSVSKMLEMAERFVEQTRKEAEAEAASLLADAQDRARQMATDAQHRLADEVARLEGLRQRLGEDVELVSRQLDNERARLTGSLHDLLGWLEEHLKPAPGLTSLRAGSNGADAASPAVAQDDGDAQVLQLDDARREE
jgi:cell division initiation protein